MRQLPTVFNEYKRLRYLFNCSALDFQLMFVSIVMIKLLHISKGHDVASD